LWWIIIVVVIVIGNGGGIRVIRMRRRRKWSINSSRSRRRKRSELCRRNWNRIRCSHVELSIRLIRFIAVPRIFIYIHIYLGNEPDQGTIMNDERDRARE